MEQFEDIVKKHYNAVYNFIFKLSNYDQYIAEEITQETFLKAYIHISDFKGNCQIKTWLIQIAKNCFYTFSKKNKIDTISFDDIKSDFTDNSKLNADDKIIQKEMLINIRSTIESMNPKMRDVMLYRIFSELPYSQISILLSINENSAKVLYYRGKEILKATLKEDFNYEI